MNLIKKNKIWIILIIVHFIIVTGLYWIDISQNSMQYIKHSNLLNESDTSLINNLLESFSAESIDYCSWDDFDISQKSITLYKGECRIWICTEGDENETLIFETRHRIYDDIAGYLKGDFIYENRINISNSNYTIVATETTNEKNSKQLKILILELLQGGETGDGMTPLKK